MRDIKFRLWLKNYEETRGTMYYRCLPLDGYKTWLVAIDENEPYYDGDFILGEDCDVMQYIGLKDDNDKDIYEGDIITNIKGELLEVEWNDDTCKWQFSNGYDINDGETYSSYKVVVGNIYESPELLNKPQTEQA